MSLEVEGRRKCLNETCDFYYKVVLNGRLLTIFEVENDEFEGFYFETPRTSLFTYETNVWRILKWIGIREEDIEGLKIWSEMTEKEQLDYIVHRKQKFYDGL
jgi:hypothetical protein